MKRIVYDAEKYSIYEENCPKCESYKKESEKYRRKYEIAKSGLTKEERDILINLLTNEQIKHLIPNNKFDTEEYILIEQLKAKIKIV